MQKNCGTWSTVSGAVVSFGTAGKNYRGTEVENVLTTVAVRVVHRNRYGYEMRKK